MPRRIAEMTSSRPESLGDYLGSDGLRLGDFVDAEIDEEGVFLLAFLLARALERARMSGNPIGER